MFVNPFSGLFMHPIALYLARKAKRVAQDQDEIVAPDLLMAEVSLHCSNENKS